jgi:threonine aldolase
MRSFGSDNHSGVHSDVIQMLVSVNEDHTVAYGDDHYTQKATELIQEQFGQDAEPFFVFSGTGANVVGLQQMTQSYHSILCSDMAHIHCDECGAPEKMTGAKLLPIQSKHGKIYANDIQPYLHGFDFEHHSQPRVVSITQATEYGTVYTPEEIKQIKDCIDIHGMLLHMDGARIANAVVTLDCSLKEITADCGVDVLSFGGNKNGLMFGECIVFLHPGLSENFKYLRKQSTQLPAKMRFISAQYIAYLKNELWIRNAKHANQMACYLAKQIEEIPSIKITHPVQANAVFAILPNEIISSLQQNYFFYVWNEATSEVRWMTSFDTTLEEIDEFVNYIKGFVL